MRASLHHTNLLLCSMYGGSRWLTGSSTTAAIHWLMHIHSAEECVPMQVPKGPGPSAALAILQELNRAACGGRCAVGSGGKAVGCAPAPGSPCCCTWVDGHRAAVGRAQSHAHDGILNAMADHQQVATLFQFTNFVPAATWLMAPPQTTCSRSCMYLCPSPGRSMVMKVRHELRPTPYSDALCFVAA